MPTSSDTDNFNAGVVLGAVAPFLTVAYVAPGLLWKAYVMTRLWDWYVMGAFDVAPLHVVHAFGFVLLAALLTGSCHGKDERKVWVQITMPYFGPAISLLIGWVGSFWL